MVETLSTIWLYGGSYFAALATASSFFAIFFFFWTRTGDRKDKIDLETKKVYLMPIYWTLRISLIVIIFTKLTEVIFVQNFISLYGLERGFWQIMTSDAMMFMFALLAILAMNSFLMYNRKINFSYAIPIAVVSYFFLFIELTTLSLTDVNAYLVPATDSMVVKTCVYLATLVIFYASFRYFSNKLKDNK